VNLSRRASSIWHQTYLHGSDRVCIRGNPCVQKPALSFRKYQHLPIDINSYNIKHTFTGVIESAFEGILASRSLLCISGNTSIFLLTSIHITSNIPSREWSSLHSRESLRPEACSVFQEIPASSYWHQFI
jgi:hypothetical protein